MARARSQPARVDKSLGHFVKTNAESIARIAHWVPVTALDVVLDIGCGDGAVLLGLAQQTGCRGVGVEIDKDLYTRALQNAKAQGLDDLRMTFYCRPIEEVPMEELYDTQGVSLVYIYALFVAQNRAVVRLLQQMLARGVRVVSSTFELPYRDFGPFERVWPDTDTPEGLLEFIGPSCTTRLHLYPGDSAVDTEARKAAVEAVRADAHRICQMSKRLRGDRDVVFLAVRADGLLLQYASAFLRDDENMVWTAVSTAPKAVKYASIRMRESQKLAQHVVGVQPSLIRYFPRHLKLPLECQIRAVERSERAAAFLLSCAPSSIRQRERLKFSKRPWERFQRPGKSAGRPDTHPDPDPAQPILGNRADDRQDGKRLLRRQVTGSELSRTSRSESSGSDPDPGQPFPDRRNRPSTPRRNAKGPELSRASTSASSSSDPGLGRQLPSNREDDLQDEKSSPQRQVNASELSTTGRSGSSSSSCSDRDRGRPFPGNRGDDPHDRKSTARREVNRSDLGGARRSGSSSSSSGSSNTQLTEDCSTSRSHDACSTEDFCTSCQSLLTVEVGKAKLDLHLHLPHLLPHAPQCDTGEVPSRRESGGQATESSGPATESNRQATQELSATLEDSRGTTSGDSEGSHSQTVHSEGDGLLARESTRHPEAQEEQEAQEGGQCLESEDPVEQLPYLPGEVPWQCQSCNEETGHSYSSTTCFFCGELRGQGQVAESWGELDPSSDSLYPEVRGELHCDAVHTVHAVHTADGWRLPLVTDSGAELLRQGLLEGMTLEAPESHACTWEVLPPWQLWHRSRNDTLQLFNTVSRKCEMFFPRFRR